MFRILFNLIIIMMIINVANSQYNNLPSSKSLSSASSSSKISPSNRAREKINQNSSSNQAKTNLNQGKNDYQNIKGQGGGGHGSDQSTFNSYDNFNNDNNVQKGTKSLNKPILTKNNYNNNDGNNFNDNNNNYNNENIDQNTLDKIKEIINAAVRTKFSMETKEADFETDEIDHSPRVIEIGGSNLPLEIHFRSSASRINIKQSLDNDDSDQQTIGPMKTNSKPTRIVQEIHKPIIAEIHEIITPYRKVIQEIKPVSEEIHTIVTKEKKRKKSKQQKPHHHQNQPEHHGTNIGNIDNRRQQNAGGTTGNKFTKNDQQIFEENYPTIQPSPIPTSISEPMEQQPEQRYESNDNYEPSSTKPSKPIQQQSEPDDISIQQQHLL